MNRIESCIVAAYPHHLLQLTADKSGGHFAAVLKIEQEKETARHDKARREKAQRQPDNATDNRANWPIVLPRQLLPLSVRVCVCVHYATAIESGLGLLILDMRFPLCQWDATGRSCQWRLLLIFSVN